PAIRFVKSFIVLSTVVRLDRIRITIGRQNASVRFDAHPCECKLKCWSEQVMKKGSIVSSVSPPISTRRRTHSDSRLPFCLRRRTLSAPVLERDFSTCGVYLAVRNSVRRVRIILLCSSVVLLIGGALYLSRRDKEEPLSPPQPVTVQTDSFQRLAPETLAQLSAIEAKEQQMNETVWAPEILAQECSRTFETLWDSINAATNKLNILALFQPRELLVPKWKQPKSLVHGIELIEPDGPGGALGNAAWQEFVAQFQSNGWQLEQIELRHNQFDTNSSKSAKQSHFYFSAHLVNTNKIGRAH